MSASALDVLRQIKQQRRQGGAVSGSSKPVEWGNADFITGVGLENLTRKELKNHLEARDLDTAGNRLELLDRLRTSLADEQLHKFAYSETLDTELLIQADLEERGSVYVCGLNDRGQLGLGDMDERRFFSAVRPLRGIGVVYVASGMDMTYAITQDHDVYVWGGGGVGRTGINPSVKQRGKAARPNNYLEPLLVSEMAGEECSAIVVGSSHCLAMGRGGDCFVWGDNDVGQLGLGGFDNKKVMCINNSFPTLKQISAGSNHATVLTVKGEVYSWGHALNGRLGLGDLERVGADERTKYFFPVPDYIRAFETISMISCGADHTLAVGPSGCWSWGNGSGFKLGLGDIQDRKVPNLIPKLRGRSIIQIAASTWHSVAIVQYPPILEGGYVFTWGTGYHGQLAHGTETVTKEPAVVEYFLHVHEMIRAIATGPNHCLAVTREGEVYSWGSNQHGALGRKLIEKDVNYSSMPGHVGGFGSLVDRIGRGFPRCLSCGKDFSVVVTYPYEGPDYNVATKLMEEAKIREQEALLAANRADVGTR